MSRVIANVTGVAVRKRVLLIEGPPKAGKSTLALALIDRGAVLVGDDAITVERQGDRITASPPPNTHGSIEIHNVGIVEMPTASGIIALILSLDPGAPHFPLNIVEREIDGVAIPVLPFSPGGEAQALRAEHALGAHGLTLPKGSQSG